MSEYNRENMDKWRQHANGTEPSIPVPSTAEKLGNKISAEYQRFTGHTAALDRSAGNDPGAGRAAVQAEVNYDHLLDHYPDGAPRDHIAMYALADAVPQLPISTVEIPDNITLGD